MYNVNFSMHRRQRLCVISAMFHEGYKAECIHARNCAMPHVLNVAVDHVQGDDYPVYSDYVALPPRPRLRLPGVQRLRRVTTTSKVTTTRCTATTSRYHHVHGDDYPVYSDYVVLPPRPR